MSFEGINRNHGLVLSRPKDRALGSKLASRMYMGTPIIIMEDQEVHIEGSKTQAIRSRQNANLITRSRR